MLGGEVSMDFQKQSAIAKLKALTSTSEHFEIKHAAHYIVVNVSERTSKTALNDLKKQLSKLLANVVDQRDYAYFENAFNELMSVLPENVQEKAARTSELDSHSGLLLSYGSTTISSSTVVIAENTIDIDDSSPLLRQRKAISKKRSGLFNKK